ncbi:hypothetical protein [Acinetobacter towneri]|uniref:hypothetical protein n=1 Tax=Acinetobacter towneri TaxID=202956 RepID=UPI001F625E22|nr:hypothetical protein [Acinetobacter towneri]UNT61069.1 hypothetical protein IHE36_08885 [Acinetobacter towneri]
MNLIEQLGGYGKAKEIVFDPLHPQMTHVSNDGRHWVNEEFSHIPEIQEQIPTMIRIKDIRKALLEYRRQHNIFEVGDKVVFKDGSHALDRCDLGSGEVLVIKDIDFYDYLIFECSPHGHGQK